MKWEVGPTWLSAELKLAEHQGTIITPLTHTPTHKELWGMRLKHMGNGYMGHTSTLAVIISWGCVHTRKHIRVYMISKTPKPMVETPPDHSFSL